jgi:HK97 family phage major capsid protein
VKLYDYRKLEEDAKPLQARVTALAALENPSAAEQAEAASLMGQISAIESIAGQMKDHELAELRAMVAAGETVADGGETPDQKHRAAFMNYLRTGDDGPLKIENASLSYTDANGGYIVPEPMHAELIEKIRKNDPIFGRATVFNLTGDPTIVLPFKASHGVATNAAETDARVEQNAPTFTGPTLTCYDYYSDQRATQLALDAVPNLENMLVQWMYEDIQEQAGADAVAGDGATKIKGLFAETASYTTKLSGVAGALANTNFLTVQFALPMKYRRDAVWLMSGATLSVVAAFSHPAASSTVPLATQDPNTGEYRILGKPVVETDSAPAIGAANYPVAFANIGAAYAVGIHRNTTILRDPYTATPKIRFYSLARLGGCAWDHQAAVLLKSNNA